MSQPVIRGSGIQSIVAASINVNFPAGSAVGDRAIVFGGTAYNVSLPSGWTAPINIVDRGSAWGPFCFTKVLTTGDISTGHVTVNFSNSYDVIAAIVTYVGDPGIPRVATQDQGGQFGAIDANGLGDANNTALSFGVMRNSGGARTIATGLGTQLQFLDDTANAFGVLTNITSVNGFISQTWDYGSGTSLGDSVQMVAVIGPVPTTPVGVPTVIEREFGEQLEPWNLQGLDSGVDFILGALEVGDFVLVSYTFHTSSGVPTISDSFNALNFVPLYTDTQNGYWYAKVTAAVAAGDIITFGQYGYSSAGRAIVVRGGSGGFNFSIANGATSPIAALLGNTSVSIPFSSPGFGPWTAVMAQVAGIVSNNLVLMTTIAGLPVGNPGSTWTDVFPSDDSYADVYSQIIANPTPPPPVTVSNAPGPGVWVLDIADVNNNPILQGIPLVTGCDLLGQFGYLNFGGQLIVETDNDTDAIPTFQNLGKQGNLYFVVLPAEEDD